MKDRAKSTFHSTAKQAAMIASKANVNELLLGHYSARYPSIFGFEQEAKELFQNVKAVQDGDVIRLSS
jgi:ribonuclease Z